MKSIAVVTVARSDYGIYLPVLRRIEEDPDLRLSLIVGGMHLSDGFGRTVEVIEADGFVIRDRVDMLLSSDSPESISKSVGLGTIGFAQAYARCRPDVLLLLGDRFEMLAAAVAALPFKIPLAHIHGGESTEGLIDEPIRHSITKMSHVHFAATKFYGERIVQMGEEPWRVVVSGAPALDHLSTMSLSSRHELEHRFGVDLSDDTLLVTYHPVTLEYEQTASQMQNLLDALADSNCNVIFTHPNADTNGRTIIEMIREFTKEHAGAKAVVNLGTQAYFSLLSHVSAMVGNSSSGIIEAASFQLPVVNIGNRQRGRIRAANVIDAGNRRDEIVEAIQTALDPGFRDGLCGLDNPYGNGHAAERIVAGLKRIEPSERLLMKKFCDLPRTEPIGRETAALPLAG